MNKMAEQKIKAIIEKIQTCPITCEYLDINNFKAILTLVKGQYKIVSNKGFNILPKKDNNQQINAIPWNGNVPVNKCIS